MIAYLDLPSGISGDMFLGCLLDAGWPVDQLQSAIALLGLAPDEWSVSASTIKKGHFRATLANITAKEGHKHRHLHHITDMITASALPASVKDKTIAVFSRLAAAEARVHGSTIEKVHFHEVGAVDAIIDIVGTISGLAALGIEKLYASPLPMGSGWTGGDHGKMPLPAPATLELLSAVNAPTRPAPGPGEWVTPTGAALLAELATFQQPHMTLQRIGIGAGTRDSEWPNIARLWLGELLSRGPMVQIETNIDDMNPQIYSVVSEKLFAAGAVDVWFTPIQMKKNRPAIMLCALAPSSIQNQISHIILKETTTLGVRVTPIERHEALREMKTVSTPYGTLSVKLKRLDGELIAAAPEFEDCKSAAAKSNVPVRQVLESAIAAAQSLLPPQP